MRRSRRRKQVRRATLMESYCGRLGQLVDHKRAEVALLLAKENAEMAAQAAQAANRAKTEFLANMSHEIRTPMNGVLGMTDLLSRSELTSRQRRFVNTAQQSAESLLSIINDILDFSKIEAGRFELDHADFDLRETISDVIELLARSAQKKGLEIAYMFSREVPQWVRGDPNRLRQIIYNLVGNGIKFTSDGEVVVRVDVDEVAQETITISVEVTDTGIGFLAEEENRVLQPFEQADSTITRSYGGTGLGLSIAKRLIEMMEGKLSINTSPGIGSTFRFTVKVKAVQISQDAERGRVFNMSGTKALIIDDNETNREILHYYLSEWGIEADAAADGPHGLSLLRTSADRKDPYRIVLLDMMMPGMDGKEVAQTILADSNISSAHLVILTSMGCDNSILGEMDPGRVVFLTKPVRRNDLYNQIGILLDADTGSPLVTAEIIGKQQETPSINETFDASILLAEDNPVNQEVMIAQLKALGCQVDVATTGQEVLAAVKKSSYDMILMDCQMPEMDGLEATTMLRLEERQHNDRRRIPVIAVTANVVAGERERCLAAGMDDYLSKPLKQADLAEKLERWLNESGPIENIICNKSEVA